MTYAWNLMTTTHYERLSFLDSTFLAMESPTTPMHVGATLIFESGPGPEGRIDVEGLRSLIAERLRYVPRYRQRLEWIPIERHPVWVDDPYFDLEFHIRHAALPRPGTEAQLRSMAGRVFAQRLDRSRPLWECWVVEGLEGGRFALVTKVHHCMVDGVAGVDLLKTLLTPFPDATVGDPAPYEPRPAPTRGDLLCDELIRRLRGPIDASRGLRRFLDETRDIEAEVRHRARAVLMTARSGWLQNASPTPINQQVGPNRSVAWVETDLADLKEVKNRFGGTINDVVIAIVAGALGGFLREDHGVDVAGLDFRAMVPVSLRDADPAGELGNRLTMWLMNLPLAEPDPATRLGQVITTTQRLKETNQALGASMLTQGAAWTPGTLLSVAARVAASTARPFNLTVTNVPGPQIPLYLMESRMAANYPLVPLWANHGLSIALFSYDGRVCWGLAADSAMVPDLDLVAGRVAASADEMLIAAGTPPANRPAEPEAV
jgi:WS/DGAT/MGAT family acyltransferase